MRRQNLLELLQKLDGHRGSRPNSEENSRRKKKSPPADDLTESRPHHLAGFRVDPGRCNAVWPWQTGGQLSGTDPAGVQLGR